MKIKMRDMACLAWMCALAIAQEALAAYPPLKLDDRVRAQEAIERVYFNHRIWPKENPGPKPPFEQMISRAQIEAKVEDYLKKSAALEKFWQRPITGEQLQAEIVRMAKQTKDPDTLKELFVALDNDPYLIAECLARPILADRLIHNWYAYDTRFHAEARAKAEKALRELTPENFATFPEGSYSKSLLIQRKPDGEDEYRSRSVSADSPTIIRLDESEFNTMRKRMQDSDGPLSIHETEDGFSIAHPVCMDDVAMELEVRYFPKMDFGTWWISRKAGSDFGSMPPLPASPVFTLPAADLLKDSSSSDVWVHCLLNDGPEGRYHHTAVWTGAEMIVWGGIALGNASNTGNRYNPSTDTWTVVSLGSGCPTGRTDHTAAWTGSEMIIWGGAGRQGDDADSTGARYNPSSDAWMAISTSGSPSGRSLHTVVWTGNEMLVWGGIDSGTHLVVNTGGRYNPSKDLWSPIYTGPDCPIPRTGHTAVWTGSEMIVWGGDPGVYPGYTNSGGRYDPSTNSWTATSVGDDCPSGRWGHTAVWAGREMIIWGGYGAPFLDSGGRYIPSSDSWAPTSEGTDCPVGRYGHTAVWTGSEMIIWGGVSYVSPSDQNSGGRYAPASNSWIPTSTGQNCPSGRQGHSAVWTGTEMIIWGGLEEANTGGRYDPSMDSWVPTSPGVSGRAGHTAVWTGVEMVLWGGFVYYSQYGAYLNSGARYYPSTDSMSVTTTAGDCPSPRSGHSAVWTGLEMIVWGGEGNCSDPDGCYKNTGARYDPQADSWMVTSAGTDCPSVRAGHAAVWTGTEMIIWGGAGSYTSAEDEYKKSGGRYDPSTDLWTATSTGADCPAGRSGPAAVWTGTEMILWGGISNYQAVGGGGRYDPSLNEWLPMSAEGSPSAREGASAVWTGSEMIVWGGEGNYSDPDGYYKNTGARYDPFTDSWTPTSLGTDCPLGRAWSTAVWTGREMIVWGGYAYDTSAHEFNSGGLYDPINDSWRATSLNGYCPSGRYIHSAVWAGTMMIVWGGYPGMATGGILKVGYPSDHPRPVGKP